MAHIDTFLYWLLAEAGFTEDDNLAMLHEELQETLLDRLNARIMERIPEDKWEEAGELLHDENSQKWEDFVHQYIPEYDDFLASVCDEFAQEYLENMDQDVEMPEIVEEDIDMSWDDEDSVEVDEDLLPKKAA